MLLRGHLLAKCSLVGEDMGISCFLCPVTLLPRVFSLHPLTCALLPKHAALWSRVDPLLCIQDCFQLQLGRSCSVPSLAEYETREHHCCFSLLEDAICVQPLAFPVCVGGSRKTGQQHSLTCAAMHCQCSTLWLSAEHPACFELLLGLVTAQHASRGAEHCEPCFPPAFCAAQLGGGQENLPFLHLCPLGGFSCSSIMRENQFWLCD